MLLHLDKCVDSWCYNKTVALGHSLEHKASYTQAVYKHDCRVTAGSDSGSQTRCLKKQYLKLLLPMQK